VGLGSEGRGSKTPFLGTLELTLLRIVSQTSNVYTEANCNWLQLSVEVWVVLPGFLTTQIQTLHYATIPKALSASTFSRVYNPQQIEVAAYCLKKRPEFVQRNPEP